MVVFFFFFFPFFSYLFVYIYSFTSEFFFITLCSFVRACERECVHACVYVHHFLIKQNHKLLLSTLFI